MCPAATAREGPAAGLGECLSKPRSGGPFDKLKAYGLWMTDLPRRSAPLTVRAELVEAPSGLRRPFDKLKANGTWMTDLPQRSAAA